MKLLPVIKYESMSDKILTIYANFYEIVKQKYDSNLKKNIRALEKLRKASIIKMPTRAVSQCTTVRKLNQKPFMTSSVVIKTPEKLFTSLQRSCSNIKTRPNSDRLSLVKKIADNYFNETGVAFKAPESTSMWTQETNLKFDFSSTIKYLNFSAQNGKTPDTERKPRFKFNGTPLPWKQNKYNL